MDQTVADITDTSFLLGRAMKKKIFEATFKNGEINMMHVHVLGLLSCSQSMTMKQLADRLKITAPSATSLVEKLVKLGLIERERDPKNRRSVLVRISKKGKTSYDNKISESRKAMASVLSALSQDDQKEYLRILTILSESLDAKNSDDCCCL